MNKEIAHYVVTAHPPGGVLKTCKCNFLSPFSLDVLVAKSRRLEVRRLKVSAEQQQQQQDNQHHPDSPTMAAAAAAAALPSPFPVLLQVPLNGRLIALEPLNIPSSPTSFVFLATDQHRYAVISYHPVTTGDGNGGSGLVQAPAAQSSLHHHPWEEHELSGGYSCNPYPIETHAFGSFREDDTLIVGGGREAESGPLVAVDPACRCIAMHLYDGLITILPVDRDYKAAALSSGVGKTAGTSNFDTGKPFATESSRGGGGRSGGSARGSSRRVLKRPFHCRIEERTVLAICFLRTEETTSGGGGGGMPSLVLLHQDARGAQHVTSHVVNLKKQQLHLYGSSSAPPTTAWLRKSNLDGGSSLLLPVPPRISSPPAATAASAASASAPPTIVPAVTTTHHQDGTSFSSGPSKQVTGGVVVVGQRQLTYCSSASIKVVPVPQSLFLTAEELPADPAGMPRYLLGDEFGNLHMLTLMAVHERIVAMQLDTLGSCTLSSSLGYLGDGLVYVGSQFGDSQLVQIHDEPIAMEDGNSNTAQQQQQQRSSFDADDEAGVDTPGGSVLDGVADDVDLLDATYLSVVEEYTHLGPILDFDLVPTTASASNSSGGGADVAGAATGGGKSAEAGAAGGGGHVPSSSTVHQQCQVVTASGSSKSGSIRLIRNGIGMNEYACQEIPGISNMWSLRNAWADVDDAYLVQSFVGETRVLGVTTTNVGGDSSMQEEEVGGTLEEVMLPGLESSASTLYVGNVCHGDRLLQITESEIRLLRNTGAATSTSAMMMMPSDQDVFMASPDSSAALLDTWSGPITVATANEAGQIAVALAGGMVVYFVVDKQNGDKLCKVCEKQMERQVSCLDLHPFAAANKTISLDASMSNAMDVDGEASPSAAVADKSSLLAVGLWDDFTVRLLSLQDDARGTSLEEALCINLSTEEDEDAGEDNNNAGGGGGGTTTSSTSRRNRNNMMARSLCLITLDFSSSSSSSGGGGGNASGGGTSTSSASSPGVNMLFVGLGDGTLISFAVVQTLQTPTAASGGSRGGASGGSVQVQSKKEVCLGTQRIDLVPLSTERGGSCVLATGDRPTVIYLAGIGGTSANQYFNPKLCYSNVNLAAAAADEEPGATTTTTTMMSSDDVSRPPSQQSIAVNVATPFFSPLLFDAAALGNQHYSLCVADEANLRLGVIDDIQKLHVTTCRLGMAPRRICHCVHGRLFAVGCIESGIKHFGLEGDEANMGNCIRFMDDTTFDDLERIDLEPYEMILSMLYATLKVPLSAGSAQATTSDGGGNHSSVGGGRGGAGFVYKPFLLVGTAYALPDEDEPNRGRILVYSCQADTTGGATSATSAGGAAGAGAGGGGETASGRAVRHVTELSTQGGVYSMCQFYDGKIMCTINSKTQLIQLVDDNTGILKLMLLGAGHHGHILSLFVKSRAKGDAMQLAPGQAGGGAGMAMDVSDSAGNASGNAGGTGGEKKKPGDESLTRIAGASTSSGETEKLAIVGDLMRSISLLQYYPQHETLEEVARDFNSNWTTAVEMLTDNCYLGAENWNNLFCLRRNAAATSEEVRCRLDTIGEFHLGEMCNKFMSGSLVMPVSTNNASSATGGSGASRRAVRRTSPGKKKGADSSATTAPGSGTGTPTSPSKGGGSSAARSIRRPVVVTGSQTLFGTVDGTLGVCLGLDGPTAAFFACLERCMANVIRPVGHFSHQMYRACRNDRRLHPAHGFVDGDLVESFLDMDRFTMEAVVEEMNRDGGWEVGDVTRFSAAVNNNNNSSSNNNNTGSNSGDDNNKKEPAGAGRGGGDEASEHVEDPPELSVDDVLAMVEEMTMLH